MVLPMGEIAMTPDKTQAVMENATSPEEIRAFEYGFEAGRKKEREHCNGVIQKFWRIFFQRGWTFEDIDALLLRVKEGDKP